jgi:hypothetical protein
MESWDTQLRKGGLELAVLLLLSRCLQPEEFKD